MQHDRAIDRDALAALLPEDLAPIVTHLPGCDDCGDVHIDTSVAGLLRIINAMLDSQDDAWRGGALKSCIRVLQQGSPNALSS